MREKRRGQDVEGGAWMMWVLMTRALASGAGGRVRWKLAARRCSRCEVTGGEGDVQRERREDGTVEVAGNYAWRAGISRRLREAASSCLAEVAAAAAADAAAAEAAAGGGSGCMKRNEPQEMLFGCCEGFNVIFM
jgi:hypothetical protein